MKKIKQIYDAAVKWLLASNNWKHVSIYFLIAFISFSIGKGLGMNNLLGLYCGLVASISAGCTAEIKDRQWGGKFSWVDLFADIIGAICGILFSLWVF